MPWKVRIFLPGPLPSTSEDQLPLGIPFFLRASYCTCSGGCLAPPPPSSAPSHTAPSGGLNAIGGVYEEDMVWLIPVGNLPTMQKTKVRFLGREDPLKKGVATNSENSMDRGAWWAKVHGVSESQTRLID